MGVKVPTGEERCRCLACYRAVRGRAGFVALCSNADAINRVRDDPAIDFELRSVSLYRLPPTA
jgi:hypothetical protein